MKKTAAILYTTITGNTEKIAERLRSFLEGDGWNVICLRNRECLNARISADLYIVGFWVRKTSLNDIAKKIVDMYEGEDMLLFGTLGNYPTGEYADLVRRNVTDYVNRKNRCVDIFLSQGAIPAERTERRRKLSPDAPHYLDDEGYKRHLESRKHPSEEDLQNAEDWLKRELETK